MAPSSLPRRPATGGSADPGDDPVDLFTPAPRVAAPSPPSAPVRSAVAPAVVPGRVVAAVPAVRARRRAWLLAAASALAACGAVVAVLLGRPAPVGEPAIAVPAAASPPVGSAAPVRLPGPGSRDWVAPGVSPDGGLVRAAVAPEAIEFRAADTRPGRPGPVEVSWSGGVAPEPTGSRTGMLGVRPGGYVQFVVRSTGSDADLVVLVSGEVSVSTTAMGATRTSTASGTAEVVAVPLGAGDATVTVAPAGGSEIGVVSAELR